MNDEQIHKSQFGYCANDQFPVFIVGNDFVVMEPGVDTIFPGNNITELQTLKRPEIEPKVRRLCKDGNVKVKVWKSTHKKRFQV